MSKTPLLDELRAERERQEAEILAPAINRISKIQNDYVELFKEKNRIAKLATDEFGKYLLQEFLAQLSLHFRKKYLRAIKKLGKDKLITIRISEQTLKLMFPDEFERYCLQHYCMEHVEEKADMGVSEDILNSKVQILHLHIPKMDYHKTVEIVE